MSHEVLIGDGLPVVADDGIVGASPEIRRSHRAYKDAARAQESHASLLVPDFDAIDDEPGSPEDPRISATADEEVYERQSEVYEDKDDPRAEAFRSSQRVLSDRVSAIMSLSKEQLKSDSKADMKVPSSSMIISCPDDSFAPEDPRGHKLADDECLDFQEQQQFRPQNPLTISPKKPSQILVVKSSPAGEKMTADMELASFFLDQQGRSAASSIDDRTTPSSSSQGVSSSFGNFDASDRAPYASRPTSEEILAASRPTSQDVLYASRPVSHESQESRMISSNSFLSIREALPPNDDQDDVGSPSQRVSSSELDVVEISLINDENANDDDLARARSMLVAEDSKEEDPRFRHDLAEADRGHTLLLLQWVYQRLQMERERRENAIAQVQSSTAPSGRLFAPKHRSPFSINKISAPLQSIERPIDQRALDTIQNVAEVSTLGHPLARALANVGDEFGQLQATERTCANLGLLSAGPFVQLLGHYEEPVGGNNTQCYEISTRDDLKEYEQCTRTEWDENLIRECDGDQDVVISRNRSDSKVAAAFTRLLGRLNLYNVMDKSSDDDVDEILLSEILSRSGASRLTFNRSLGGGTSIETVFERQPSGRRQMSRRDDSSSLVLEAFARLVERAAATELVLDLTIDIRCFALRERARLLDAIERGELLRDFNRNLHGDLAASLTGIGNAMYKSGRPQAATVAFRGAFIAKSRHVRRCKRMVELAKQSLVKNNLIHTLEEEARLAEAALLPTLFNMGSTQLASHAFCAASTSYGEALEIARRLGEHVAEARAMHEKASCLEYHFKTHRSSKTGYHHHDTVIAAYTAALAARARALGQRHLEVADTLFCRGRAAYRAHLFDIALSDQRTALDIRADILGHDDPTIATTIKNMAFTLAAKRDYRAAATEADAAIRIRSKTLGPNHPSIGSAASFAAVMCAKTGDHIAARDRHKLAATCYGNLTGSLYAKKRRNALLRVWAHSIVASSLPARAKRLNLQPSVLDD